MSQSIRQEGFKGKYGLSNVTGLPIGQPSAGDLPVTPQEYGLVTFGASSLPVSTPLPPSEYETCSLTDKILPTGFAAGDEDILLTVPELIEVPQKIDDEEHMLRLTRQEAKKSEVMFREMIEDLPRGDFYGMSFAIFNEQEIINASAVTVTSSAAEGQDTVNDPRFGVVTGNQACSTCTNTLSNCPGHIGKIDLRSPYSPDIYQKFAVQVLNSICLGCKRLMFTEQELGREGLWDWSGPVGSPDRRKIWRYHYEDRLRKISDLAKTRTSKCTRHIYDEPHTSPCITSPIFTRDRGRIKYSYTKGDWKPIFLEQVRFILDGIPQEDSILLGFSPSVHPSRLIMKYLPVLPLCNRPPRPSNGQIEQDELTKIYRNIVNHNNKIVEPKLVQSDEINAPPFPKLHPFPTQDQIGVITRRNNEINKLIFGPKNKEERYVSIKKFLQGKEGLLRKYMMGKRADKTGRTVISPGPKLKYGGIGIPEVWAPILTYPVLVTADNKNALTTLMKDGKVSKVRLKRQAGHQITITPENQTSWVLEVGDVIERHMQDGDLVAFNRNPSLWKYSIMGYRVKLIKGLTIRLGIGTTPHHNADFDGDEGNIFLPRSPEAVAELKTVMNSRFCIISNQDNRALTGLIFNDLTAAYKLTQDDTMVRPKTWRDCLDMISREGKAPQLLNLKQRLEKFNVPWMSGRALFSALLPDDLYYKNGKVRIIQGILVQGPLSKTHVGATHRSVAQFIFKNYNRDETYYYGGAERAAKFLEDGQFVMKRWLEDEPVTTTLADCNPKRDPEAEVKPLFEIINNHDKLELMSWTLCKEILERHSKYADFESLPDRLEKHNIDSHSGQALISVILPKDFNLEIDGRPVIMDGVLIVKVETKSKAAGIKTAIIKKLATLYGGDRAVNFSKDINTILTRCLDISLKTGKHYQLLRQEEEKTKSAMELYGPKLKDPVEGERIKQFLITQLNRVKDIGDVIINQNLDPANNFSLIVNGAKTKGSAVNILQVVGMLGGQFTGNEMFSEDNSSIYQVPGDWDPEGFGIIKENFRDGLRPPGFLHHLRAARVGLVDTSIKTAEPGALSRLVVKNTEGILVQRDRTVRLHGRNIVQSVYGYTGFNPERMININFPEGEIPFFIDIQSVVARINGNFGYFDYRKSN